MTYYAAQCSKIRLAAGIETRKGRKVYICPLKENNKENEQPKRLLVL